MTTPSTRVALRELLGVATVVVVTGLCALRPIWNSDIWWHVVVGDWIRAHRALPGADVWSAQEGGTWSSFSWLYQILVSLAHGHLGMEGVRLLSALFVTGVFVLFYTLARRAGASVGHALLLTLGLLLAYHYRIRVRPHVVNLLAFTALAFYVRWAAPRWWHAGLAMAGFLVWSALHAGGALIGAGAVVVSLASTASLAAEPSLRPQRTRFFGIGLAALIGWLAVPGSFRTVMVVAGEQGQTISQIAEWVSYPGMFGQLGGQPSALATLHLVACLAVWPVTAVIWILSMRRHLRERYTLTTVARTRTDLGLVLSAYLLLIAALWFRFYYLSVVAMVLLPFVTASTRSAPAGQRLRLRRLAHAVGTAALALLACAYTTVGQFGSVEAGLASRLDTYDARYYPVAEAELLGESGLDVRVATIAAWGGFVLYQGRAADGTTRLRPTMDGRNASSPEVTVLHMSIEAALRTCRGVEELPAMYAALPADVLLMPAPHPRCPGMPENPVWLRVSQSPQAEIFLRRGPETGEWIQALSRVFEARRGALP